MSRDDELRAIHLRLDRLELGLSARHGVLTFNLPEEQNAFEIAVKATDFALAWNDLQNVIRNRLKYADCPEEKAAAYEGIRDTMAEIEAERELPGVE